MSAFDIFYAVLLVLLGAFGAFAAISRKSRRGQSKFVAFVISLLFLAGGIICLIFGFPISEYLFD